MHHIDERMNTRTLARVLRQRKRLVLGCVVGFGALGLAVNAMMPSAYRATAQIEIRKSVDRMPLTGERAPGRSFQSERMDLFTAAGLIENRALLSDLLIDMTEKDPVLLTGAPGSPKPSGLLDEITGIGASLASPVRPASTTPVADAHPAVHQARVDWLKKSIQVEPIPDTRLVNLHVEHADPEAAQQVADLLAMRFVDYMNGRAAAMDTAGMQLLRERIESTRSAVLASVDDRLARLDGVLAGRMSYAQAGLDGGVFESLRKDLTRCQAELAAARKVYKDKHPKLAALRAECGGIESAMRAEVRRAAADLRQARARFAAHDFAAEFALHEGAPVVDEAPILYAALGDQVKPNLELYEELVTRAAETRLVGRTENPSAEVVHAATVRREAVRPHRLLNLMIFPLAGLFVGVGLSLFGHSLRGGVQDPEDLEELLGLPVLDVIPKRS